MDPANLILIFVWPIEDTTSKLNHLYWKFLFWHFHHDIFFLSNETGLKTFSIMLKCRRHCFFYKLNVFIDTNIFFIIRRMAAIISIGNSFLRPNINKFGEHLVLSCITAWYAIITYGRWSSQSVLCLFTNSESICCRVRFNPWTIPSDWGIYGVVRVFYMSSFIHISENNWDLNSLPWSVWIRYGVP